MIVELILVGGLAAAGGTAGYLYFVNLRSKAIEAEEAKARMTEFKKALLRDLKMMRRGEFDFEDFAASWEMPFDDARRIGEEIYSRFSQKVMADGVITNEERASLDGLAEALVIEADRVIGLKQRAKGIVYRNAVSEALFDGVVTHAEAAELESLRKSLGIRRTEGLGMIEDITRDSYVSMLQRIVGAGELDVRSEGELSRFKQALAVSDTDALRIIREQSVALYREAFTSVVQDGDVTPQEEAFLRWLQSEAGLSNEAVLPYLQQIQEVKRLAEYRSGQLPSIRTRKMLEGGEICHWDGACHFAYQTRTKHCEAAGELVVTSKRVLFNSATKNISYAPWKIIDIVLYREALDLKVDASQGTGRYFVSDTKELEAILVGVARKGKYLVTDGFASSKTRHIPGNVKREVWARDGGRCIQCNSDNYLEFDHIIPHTKGGANTINNVQLLCRGCNNLKSDKI